MAAVTSTNGFAIAALVLGIIGIPGIIIFFNIFALLALIFGLVARSQILRSGGSQAGLGMAIAGIVLGALGIVGEVLFIVVAATSSPPSGGGYLGG